MATELEQLEGSIERHAWQGWIFLALNIACFTALAYIHSWIAIASVFGVFGAAFGLRENGKRLGMRETRRLYDGH